MDTLIQGNKNKENTQEDINEAEIKTGFNLFNILLLAGFAVPLLYLFIAFFSDEDLFDDLFACNPYIEQSAPSHLPASTTCQVITKLHLSDIQEGIDVSHYQGKVLWHQVAASGRSFAIAKATGGEDYIDPNFTVNWHGIRQHELIRGAYHFFYASDDPEKQAEHFLTTVGKIRKTDLPPILDVEISDQMSSEKLIEHTLIWLQKVEQATQRKPIIYTNSAFGQEFLSDPRFGRYYLWLANYSDEDPVAPDAWKNKQWFLWQHAQDGKVEGIDGHVDLSHYRGSIKNLQTFIRQSNL